MTNPFGLFRSPALALCLLAFGSSSACSRALAQQAPDTLPDAPGALIASASTASALSDVATESSSQQASTPPAAKHHEDPQPKRILGIIPNFRTVTAGTVLPRQTVKDKFVTASEDSFDYSAIIFSGLLAGEAMATKATPEFRQGAAGYGRYFWHTYTDQTVENLSVEFIVPVITHEDTRFYSMGKGGFHKRSIYALEHVFVTKTDSGKTTFNSGEVVGAGAAAALSNLYYPRQERTVGNTLTKWGTNIGIDAGTFLFKEFYPDLNHSLFHRKDQTVVNP